MNGLVPLGLTLPSLMLLVNVVPQIVYKSDVLQHNTTVSVVVCVKEFAQLVMMSLCTKYAVSVMIYSIRASSLFILQLLQIASEFFVLVENLKAQLVQIRMMLIPSHKCKDMWHYITTLCPMDNQCIVLS